MDGGGDPGDRRDSIFGNFNDGRLEIEFESWNRNNLTFFHDRIVEFLGFNHLDNGKLSGLAAYGKVKKQLISFFESLETKNENHNFGTFNIERIERSQTDPNLFNNDNYLLDKVINPSPGRQCFNDELSKWDPLDVAASAEFFLHSQVLSQIGKLLPKNRRVPLVVSGGLFSNVQLNQKVAQLPNVSEFHCSMAPGDAGISLGAGLLESNKNEYPIYQSNPFLGPKFDVEESMNALSNCGISEDSNSS